MPHQRLNPEGVSTPTGYSHVVIPQGTRLVYFSGQIAIDAQGQLVGAGDVRRQAEQVFENLKTCLAAVGATFEDVVKLNHYVVNLAENRSVVGEMRQRYLPADKLPASTLIGVQALARPELLIEIEAVAVLP